MFLKYRSVGKEEEITITKAKLVKETVQDKRREITLYQSRM